MKVLNILAAGVVASFLSANAYAQMDSCNVFLKGNYVEVGINPLGAFGSTIPAPAGYHANATGFTLFNPCTSGWTSSGLGFVADPNMTGWTNYYGDYYLPGTPQEGWAMQVGSLNATAYTPALSYASPVISMPGNNISYSAVGGQAMGVWQGMYDSIQITQTTTVDTNGLFFRVRIDLANLSSTAKDSVYYMRTIDPDNEVISGGSYATRNVIEHQVTSTSNLVAVSARGLVDTNSYMALAADDSRAKCFIINYSLTPSNPPSEIYGGVSGYLTSGSMNADEGIGLIFNIGHLASVDSAADSVGRKTTSLHPANSASFSFVYAFKYGVADTVAGNGSSHTTGIAAVKGNIVAISPNPVIDNAVVSGLSAGEAVSVYDMAGRQWINNVASGDRTVIDTHQLLGGIYLFVIKDAAGMTKERLRVQKN
jgi:hypothetical protein